MGTCPPPQCSTGWLSPDYLTLFMRQHEPGASAYTEQHQHNLYTLMTWLFLKSIFIHALWKACATLVTQYIQTNTTQPPCLWLRASFLKEKRMIWSLDTFGIIKSLKGPTSVNDEPINVPQARSIKSLTFEKIQFRLSKTDIWKIFFDELSLLL